MEHLPIPDFGTPDLNDLHEVIEWINREIADGKVLVHCLGGIGRSGMVATTYLISKGYDVDEAIKCVRARVPRAIETYEQEELLRFFMLVIYIRGLYIRKSKRMSWIIIVLKEIGTQILFHFPAMIKKRLVSADKWIGKDFHFRDDAEIKEALRSESIGTSGYPMNRVWLRIKWENRSKENVKLIKVFLRIYVNSAPLRIIEWDEKEISYYPSAGDYEEEISIYGGENYSLPKNRDGFLDVFVNIPPYIDINKKFYLDILGYSTFSSSFGPFDEKVNCCNLRVEPMKWE